MSSHEILDEKVLDQHGVLQRVRRWWQGVHPEKGVIVKGWTGWETLEERDLFRPLHIVLVKRG